MSLKLPNHLSELDINNLNEFLRQRPNAQRTPRHIEMVQMAIKALAKENEELRQMVKKLTSKSTKEKAA